MPMHEGQESVQCLKATEYWIYPTEGMIWQVLRGAVQWFAAALSVNKYHLLKTDIS